MQLRRFTHDSTAGALDAVRAAFGTEAIILSNRQVDGKVEIIATGTLDEHALATAEAMQAPTEPEPTRASGGRSEDAGPRAQPPRPAAPPAATRPARAGALQEASLDSLSRDLAALSEDEAPMSLQPPGQIGPVAIDADDQLDERRDASVGDRSNEREAPGLAPAETAASSAAAGHSAGQSSERSAQASPADMPDHPSRGRSAAPAGDRVDTASATAPRTSSEASRGDGNTDGFRRAVDRMADAPVGSPSSVGHEASAGAPSAVDLDGIEQRLALGEQRREEQASRVECRLRRLEVNLWGETDPVKAAHLRQLLRFGFGAEIAVRLVERLPQDTSADLALRRSLGLMKSSLPIGHDRTGEEPGVTVLSGPEGGGKTTALVKLATAQVRRGGADSLVIIGADNQRIGAFEMLEVYGRLLGVPVVRARSAAEMAELLAGFAHKSLVLVDHVPLEREDALPWGADPALRLEADETRRCRHLLVLPTTLESRVFESHLAAQAGHGVSHLVLTQLDRAARPGGCFAPLIRHQVPVAYVTREARVQEPLERADAARLVAMAVNAGVGAPASVDETCLSTLLQPPRREAAHVPVSTADPAVTRLGPPWTEDLVADAETPLSTVGGAPSPLVPSPVAPSASESTADGRLSLDAARSRSDNVDRTEHVL